MPISLNKVNAEAYAKVAAALEQNGKAAVEHATGTGKSCIAWQLIADHPQASFIWLVYGAARLTLRREDVRRYNDGVLPENLIFCDCGALAEASAEEWVRLASRKPDYLIFDCYHEMTAACWAKSAQRLLRLCPEAKLLGQAADTGAYFQHASVRRNPGILGNALRYPGGDEKILALGLGKMKSVLG